MENYGGDGLGVSAWNRDYLRSLVLPLDDQYMSQLGTSRVRQPDLANLRRSTNA
jgi:hypothetical protein